MSDIGRHLETAADPGKQGVFLRNNLPHWDQALRPKEIEPIPPESYHERVEDLRRATLNNLNVPTQAELEQRHGEGWHDEVKSQGINYWPTLKRLEPEARAGNAQALNDQGFIPTCLQVVAAQMSTVHAYRERLQHGEKNVPEPELAQGRHLETHMVKTQEENNIGFVKDRFFEWVEQGLIIGVSDEAAHFMHKHRERISKSAVNQKIEQVAGILDPEGHFFNRDRTLPIGTIQIDGKQYEIERDISHHKKDLTFSRLLIKESQAHAIMDRYGRPELMEQLRNQDAMLKLKDIRKAASPLKPLDEDALPASNNFELVRGRFLLGYAYPEEMQELIKHMDAQAAHGTLDWMANLLLKKNDGTEQQLTLLRMSTGELMLKPEPITLKSLGEAVEKYAMVAVVSDDSVETAADIRLEAGHSLALYGVQWQQTEGGDDKEYVKAFWSIDSGPKDTRKIVGDFLTEQGDFPLLEISAINKMLTGEYLHQHWLNASNKARLTCKETGEIIEAELSANILVPSGPPIQR